MTHTHHKQTRTSCSDAQTLSRTGLTRRELIAGAAALGFSALMAKVAQAAEFSASAETEAALADAWARYEAALAHLDYLNGLVFEAEAEYTRITEELNATIAAIAELEASITQKQAELVAAQDVLAERLTAGYKAGATSLIDVLLEATSFDDFVSRLYYANKVSDADAAAIQTVKDIKAQLEADQAALLEQQALQEQLQAEQAAQIAALQSQVADAEWYANTLDWEVQALIAQRDAEIAAAAEAARLAAEEEARRQQAAQQGAASGGSSSGSGSVDTGSSGGGGGGGWQDYSVVGVAYNYIGTPYSVLDCSSFTHSVYSDCGYYIYPQSGVQYNTVVSKGNLVGAGGLVPGNLVFYARGGSIYHVGLYIGDGMIIDSIPSGGVQVRSLYFCDGFCGGGSPL